MAASTITTSSTNHPSNKYKSTNPREYIKLAREIWLNAEQLSDIQKAKSLYEEALALSSSYGNPINNDKYNEDDNVDHPPNDDNIQPKKQKRQKRPQQYDESKNVHHCQIALTEEEQRNVQEKIALIQCQSNNHKNSEEETNQLLQRLGYHCRLSRSVLNYTIPLSSHYINKLSCSIAPHKKDDINIQSTTTITQQSPSLPFHSKSSPSPSPPCIIIDEFLNEYEQTKLASIFSNIQSSYWTDHAYQIEPPSPYFSYVIPLFSNKDPLIPTYGFIGHIINKIIQSHHIQTKFPAIKRAKFVEMWAHNRPHASGHQMHFDSDNEGQNGIRNPIISTILYIYPHYTTNHDYNNHSKTKNHDVITDINPTNTTTNNNNNNNNNNNSNNNNSNNHVRVMSGGPSLVTTQKLRDTFLAERGYLSFPKEKRLVAFSGKVLHGVVPGKGVSPALKPPTAIVHPYNINDHPTGGDTNHVENEILHHCNDNRKRRVTLMLAFWRNIQIRDEPTPGCARPFPVKDDNVKWAKQLKEPIPNSMSENDISFETPPLEINCVYETLDGKPWTRLMGMPEYDEVFQGF